MKKYCYKLTLEYDGTRYVGWQSQKNDKSIQEALEKALAVMCKEQVQVRGASRTDSGVHALGQVAAFHSTLEIPSKGVLRGLNSLLPEDIRVLSVKKMPQDFHPIREAKGKIYRYIILNDEVFSALLQYRSWFVAEKLNLAAMKKAAVHLVGKHDFASFMGSGSSVKDAIRVLSSISITTSRQDFFGMGKPSAKGRYIIFTFKGVGFVKYQIRNIVGTLVEVGKGQRVPEEMPKILAKKNRPAAGRMAPARGLYLVKVIF